MQDALLGFHTSGKTHLRSEAVASLARDLGIEEELESTRSLYVASTTITDAGVRRIMELSKEDTMTPEQAVAHMSALHGWMVSRAETMDRVVDQNQTLLYWLCGDSESPIVVSLLAMEPPLPCESTFLPFVVSNRKQVAVNTTLETVMNASDETMVDFRGEAWDALFDEFPWIPRPEAPMRKGEVPDYVRLHRRSPPILKALRVVASEVRNAAFEVTLALVDTTFLHIQEMGITHLASIYLDVLRGRILPHAPGPEWQCRLCGGTGFQKNKSGLWEHNHDRTAPTPNDARVHAHVIEIMGTAESLTAAQRSQSTMMRAHYDEKRRVFVCEVPGEARRVRRLLPRNRIHLPLNGKEFKTVGVPFTSWPAESADKVGTTALHVCGAHPCCAAFEKVLLGEEEGSQTAGASRAE